MKYGLLLASVLALFVSQATAQLAPTTAPAADAPVFLNGNGNNGNGSGIPWGSQPGEYQMISADGQMVMKSYEVTGVKPAARGNIAKLFKAMLKKDGRGGDADVAPLIRDGKEIILLNIVATEKMQRSIGQTVERINSGETGAFCYMPDTVIYFPKFRSAQAISDAIKVEMTNIGMTYVDVGLNALIIEDDPTYISFLVKDIAEKFDILPPRIQANLIVVEFEDGRDRSLGVDWASLLDTLPASMTLGMSLDRLPVGRSRSVELGKGDASLALSGDKNGFSSLKVSNFTMAVDQISPQALAGFIGYLEAKGYCRVVSNVDVNVVNGVPTVFSTKVEMPREATVSNVAGGKNRTEVQTIEGIELSIIGTLAGELKCMEIDATSTSVVCYTRTGLPVIATSHISTKTGVLFGKTVVLSGLSRQKEVEVVHGDPLGIDALRLFSKKTTEKKLWKQYVCIAASPPPDTRPAD